MIEAVLRRTLRDERPRLIAALLRSAGSIDAAEDALQDAALAALVQWPRQVPRNPAAWLLATARRRVIDRVRHARATGSASEAMQRAATMTHAEPEAVATAIDDELRVLCWLCDESLTIESQVALALHVLAGSSTEQIAERLRCAHDAASKRISRAKKQISQRSIDLDALTQARVRERLPAVLAVIFAMFTEAHGHAASRAMLDDSLRLARLLCELAPEHGPSASLLALLCFGAARDESRWTEQGASISIEHQDRARWSRPALEQGLRALHRARALGDDSVYRRHAEIAWQHCAAPCFAQTDWTEIVRQYDALVALDATPVAMLNRAIALSMRDGPEAGLRALEPLERSLAHDRWFAHARAAMLARATGRD